MFSFNNPFNHEIHGRYFVRIQPEQLQSICETILDQPLHGTRELGNPTYSDVERVQSRKNVSTNRTWLLITSSTEARQLTIVTSYSLISRLSLHNPGS